MVTKRRGTQAAAFIIAALMLGTSVPANATTIIETLPEFSYPGDAPFPSPVQNMGTFNFVIPVGEVIVSAMLEGTFGNSINTGSAGHRVFADGSLVVTCLEFASCWSTGIDPWSFNFSGFTDLLDGALAMTAIQDSENNIREGELTLTIETSAQSVPEPATLALVGFGLAGLGFARRRRPA